MPSSITATQRVYQVIGGLSKIPVIGQAAQIFGLIFGLSQGKTTAQTIAEWWAANCDNPAGTQFLPGQMLSEKAKQNPTLCVRGYVVCPPSCVPFAGYFVDKSGSTSGCYAPVSMSEADRLKTGCAPHPVKTWGLPLLAVAAILVYSWSE